MANVIDLVLRVSGTVSYTDMTHGPFEASIARSFVASPYNTDSLENYAEVAQDEPVKLADFYELLLPAVVTTTSDAPIGSRTISDVVMFMDGRVSYDDNTSASFAIEYFNGAVDHTSLDTADTFAAMVAIPANKAKVVAVLEELAGTGNVTIV